MDKVILRSDKDGVGAEDEDADGIADEVEECAAVLWEAHALISRAFSWYAAVGGGIHGMSMNEWSLFVVDHRLALKSSKFCKKRDLDRLFLAIDGATARYWRERLQQMQQKTSPEAERRLQGKGFFSRVELIGAVCHVAIIKYCATGEVADVSEALHRLLAEDISPRVDPRVVADPNNFRRDYCYTHAMCDMLAQHKESLRSIFAGIAGGGRSGAGAEVISLDEWLDYLRALGFLATDLSERDARMCFILSRMCVVDARSERGHLRDSCLPFEGFCEMCVRVALLKALPTDDEIAAARCKHAGAFMTKLKREDNAKYERLLCERARPLGRDGQPLQPPERALHHVLSMIVHTMEVETTGRDNQRLTKSEAIEWLQKHKLWGYYDACDND